MKKPVVIFVHNYIWSIENPDVSIKYELLSEHYQGLMLYLCTEKNEHVYGNFRCLSSIYHKPLKRFITYPLFCLSVARTLKNIDVIITSDPLLPGIAGYVLKLITGASLIVEVNTNNTNAMKINAKSCFSRIKNYFVPRVIRFILTKADAVKYITHKTHEEMKELGIVPKITKTIAVFHDFVPSTLFKISPAIDSFYILSIGFPYQIKGMDVLIRAFNLIKDDFPHIRLRIIGHCEDRTPYMNLTGNDPNIEFFKGIPYSEIIPQIEGCLFLVLASRAEAMGRVLIESMASGKALIGSKVGGIPELIEDGVNGYLFDSENHIMLAEKMRLLLGNPSLINQMGEAGYRIAQERYTPARYMELYQNLISEVMGTAVNPTSVPSAESDMSLR